MQPAGRPPYRARPEGDALRVEVESDDWAGLLGAAALAASDVARPLGTFDTWTARRVSARGDAPAAVLERWLATLVDDARACGFLPALVEVERAEPTSARGIHRGGAAPDDAGPPVRALDAVVGGSVVVEPGAPGRPWRATFLLR